MGERNWNVQGLWTRAVCYCKRGIGYEKKSGLSGRGLRGMAVVGECLSCEKDLRLLGR